MPGIPISVNIGYFEGQIGQSKTSLGHAGLSDYGIRLMVQDNTALAFVLYSKLSERQLWFLAP